MNQIFRENIKYIVAVLIVWAITFPIILQNNDVILATINAWYNRFAGYPNPRIAHKLMQKGDEIIEGRAKANDPWYKSISNLFSGDESQSGQVLPLDLGLMEKACLYYTTHEHISEIFLEPTWLEKSQTWDSKLFPKSEREASGQVSLGPHPKEYWNSHLEAVLEALDYYKRALRFSGPELEVPKKIEKVAWAVCRPSEILLAYKTHMLETEKIIYERLDKEGKIPTKIVEGSEFQKLAMILSIIKSGSFSDVDQNAYLESLLRQILLTGMKQFSPYEMDAVYARILFLVGNEGKEFLKFTQRRADLFFQIGKENPDYYRKAIQEYTTASNISKLSDADDVPEHILLVHEFETKLNIAICHSKLNENKESLKILDSLKPKLRNVDERSVGGAKPRILDLYNATKVSVLRNLKRYEEADELLDTK
ncbi:hypothetical protein LPTSP4_02290 [Leptospira ryugenii]|uniref:Tetratricopeptide repeat protein n=1 Tax=Leptospira ryugenii TaxID=1917863 RepID=A0A2P2DVR3_9LEPT|nr:hypothetical protein [Leptospira ryugenii]GBF48729.1 hypothetical protein LPTSP4_02290 [Leptospira ryugenii]